MRRLKARIAVKKEGAGAKAPALKYEKDFIKSEATHYIVGGTLPDARYEKNIEK